MLKARLAFVVAVFAACGSAEKGDEDKGDDKAASMSALVRTNQSLKNLAAEQAAIIKELEALKEKTRAAAVALPDSAQIDSLLTFVDDAAATAGVTVREWKQSREEPYGSVTGLRYPITVRGTYRRILELIHRIDQGQRVIGFGAMELQHRPQAGGASEVEARLELIAFQRGSGAPTRPLPVRDAIEEQDRRSVADADLSEDRTGDRNRDPMQSFTDAKRGGSRARVGSRSVDGCKTAPPAMTATADPPVELPPVVTASKNMAKDDPEHERALKLETENAELRKRLGQFVELRERVAVLERSQRDIAMLGKASLSPAALLIELGSILTPNKSPTIDEDTSRALQNDPTRQWNPKWDPKTIVLDHIVERRCHIALAGDAKSADDLAEFVKRLSASVHFDDVESSLTRGRRFHITGRAKF